MKRPIAMLLALLLTAGLFAFVSCGEKKNYTVEEVNGETRIFLDQKELDRIEREINKHGFATTVLENFDLEDETPCINDTASEKIAFTSSDLIAKCSFVEKKYIRFDEIGAHRKNMRAYWVSKVYSFILVLIF